MKKLLQFIVENIVTHPENIVIEEEIKEDGFIIYSLTVNPEDMGRVIGKEGKVINALRNILRVKATKQNIRFSLILKENS